MKRAICLGGSLLALIAAAGIVPSTAVRTLAAQGQPQAPKFEVDPLWPKPFPQKKAWILGSVTGVTVDAQDHIWVVHRGVDSLQTNEKGPALEPWASSCCFAAPQILEFDTAGTLLTAGIRKPAPATTGRMIQPASRSMTKATCGLPAACRRRRLHPRLEAAARLPLPARQAADEARRQHRLDLRRTHRS